MPPSVALTVPLSLSTTGLVVTLNVFDVAPGRILSVAGVLADASVSLRVIVTPSAGAGLVRVTVPLTLLQPGVRSLFSEKLNPGAGAMGAPAAETMMRSSKPGA